MRTIAGNEALRFRAPDCLIRQVREAAKAHGVSVSEYLRGIAQQKTQEDLERLSRISGVAA